MTEKKTDAIVKPTSAEIVPDAQNLRMLAKDLLASGLFPNVKSIAGAFTIIEYGRELGFGPVASLNTFNIIKGKLCAEAKILRALFIKNGGDIEVLQSDDETCKLNFVKSGRKPMVYEYNTADAKREGYLGKDNWVKMPKLMRFERCSSRGVRAYDPGVIMGLYSVEEMRDATPFNNKSKKKFTEQVPDEGEIPDALKTEEELAQPEDTTNDFVEAEIVQGNEMEATTADPTGVNPYGGDPATSKSPDEPDEKTVIKMNVEAECKKAKVDYKAFKKWLESYQKQVGKHYVGGKFGNPSLSEGKLIDLRLLEKFLPDAIKKFKEEGV